MNQKPPPRVGKAARSPGGCFRFGPFEFDAGSGLLYRGEQEILLPFRAAKVLETLLDRPGEVLSKDAVLGEVWQDAFVGEDSLTQAISMIRSALGDDPRSPTYIQTIPKRGYRFIAEVDAGAAAKAESAGSAQRTALSPPRRPSPPAVGVGTRLGQYEILEELGSGGMGVVYRARDAMLERDVAIKVLPDKFVSDEARIARFAREAKLLAAVSHPNIAAIYSLEESDGGKFPVLELVEGDTLQQRLRSGRIGVKETLDIARQIASALEAAHERGIVHRDLKPANIKITPDGRVKVLDFGLAKELEVKVFGEGVSEAPTESMTIMGSRRGSIVGTAAYMSPEQARGQEADRRADIWAFGCVVYEMLTGQRAFGGDTVSDTIARVLEREPDWEALPQDTPAAIRTLLARCLQKDSSRRLHHVADARIEIEEVQELQRIGARVPVDDGQRRSVHVTPWVWAAACVVAAIALLLLLYVGGWRDSLVGEPVPRIESIAVLPLENLSGDPEQEFFADGMTDELISCLGQIRALRVISRTSVMRYKGSSKSLPEIAAELGVDAILEGTVRVSGDRVRITPNLIQAATDRSLWTRQFERDLQDVLLLQNEVALAIAREIEATVTPEEVARLSAARPVNPEAHVAYLRGRDFEYRLDFLRAIDLFEQSLAHDPDYALAYAGLADTYVLMSTLAVLPPSEAGPRAKAAAVRALELDDSLAETHAALAMSEAFFDWDLRSAEARFQRAYEINPNDFNTLSGYIYYLWIVGRFEDCMELQRQALLLDPLAFDIGTDMAFTLFNARRYQESIDQVLSLLPLDPDRWAGHTILAGSYSMAGRHEDAVNSAEWLIARGGEDQQSLAVATWALGLAGHDQRAREISDRLSGLASDYWVDPVYEAIALGGLGEIGQALDKLEQGYEERSVLMTWIGVSPFFDPLRDEPRFQELMQRMNFPE